MDPADGDRRIGAVERPAFAHDRRRVADPDLVQHGREVGRWHGPHHLLTQTAGTPVANAETIICVVKRLSGKAAFSGTPAARCGSGSGM